MIRYDLPSPIPVFVKESVLYGGDESKTEWVPGTAFALDCYPGEALAFTVLLENGSIFNYLPFDAVTTKPERGGDLAPYQSVIYHNVKPGKIALQVHDFLKQPVNAFLKPEQKWLKAEYVCSLDWFEGNDLLNLLILETGQFAALPNHKMTVGKTAPQKLEPYKKLRAVLTV